jgi:Xaa-Pro aminopeptidase
MMNIGRKISRIQEILIDRNIDALLSTRHESIGYLTGVFQRSGLAMLIEPEGKPLVLSEESERLKDEAWAPDLVQIEIAAAKGLPIAKIGALVDAVKQRGLAKKRLGLERAHLTASEMETLARALPDAEWVEAGDVVGSAMLVKGADEIRALRRVAEAADAGLKRAVDTLRVGVTELEIAGEIELAIRKLGAERTWFPTHVASGYRSDLGIAFATDKVIQYNDKVVLDVGPIRQSYCGELCTQVVVGKATTEVKKLFQGVVDVHRKIIESLIPGKKASDVFHAAYDYSQELGLKGVYPSFGRGIGVVGSEELLLFRPTCETELVPGMVVATVTYIGEGPHEIGTERMTLITADGPAPLSTFPLELIEV